MMAALGQIVIPIPVVGAAIGGMIGYTLSSMFYQSALEAARGAALSRERLAQIRAVETEARACIAQQQALLDEFMAREIPQLQKIRTVSLKPLLATPIILMTSRLRLMILPPCSAPNFSSRPCLSSRILWTQINL